MTPPIANPHHVLHQVPHGLSLMLYRVSSSVSRKTGPNESNFFPRGSQLSGGVDAPPSLSVTSRTSQLRQTIVTTLICETTVGALCSVQRWFTNEMYILLSPFIVCWINVHINFLVRLLTIRQNLFLARIRGKYTEYEDLSLKVYRSGNIRNWSSSLKQPICFHP